MIREIDCNNYSKQFIARCLTNSKLVAMKKINLEIFPFTIEGLRNEINYWVMLDHPNMLKYYGSFVEKTFLYIIVEYIDGWELSDILKERHPNGFKDEVLIASILHPVLTFLSYYHQMHYIHRSLESKHIFLKMDGDVKVGGFWKAKTLFNQENSQNDKDSNTKYNALIENEHIQQSGDLITVTFKEDGILTNVEWQVLKDVSLTMKDTFTDKVLQYWYDEVVTSSQYNP